MQADVSGSTYLTVGLSFCLVASLAAVALGFYNAYWNARIRDQVEQVLDERTPSMTEHLDTDEILAPPPPEKTDGPAPPPEKTDGPVIREFGGRHFEFRR